MPNSVHPYVRHDGPRNAVVEIIGVLDDGDLEPQVVVDVTQLYAEPGYKITRLRVDTADYMVAPDIFVELLWQAKNPEHIMEMSGKGFSNQESSGGRQNTIEGATGNIMLAATGWIEGRRTFSVKLELVKQFT